MLGGGPKTHQEQFMPRVLPGTALDLLLLDLIPVFCSPGSVYKLDNMHWQRLNGDEDKARNIDSVNGKVGVDITGCWDNTVVDSSLLL